MKIHVGPVRKHAEGAPGAAASLRCRAGGSECMTWRKIDGYQYPYRINEEAQVQKWDGKQWIDIRARISGNRAEDGREPIQPV